MQILANANFLQVPKVAFGKNPLYQETCLCLFSSWRLLNNSDGTKRKTCKLYLENICSEKGQFKIRAATAVIDSKLRIHFWIMICSVTKYSLESHKFMHKTKLYSFWKLLKNPFLWFSSSPSTLWFKPLWNCI